jgi:diguanylate cyclase (GGDEF)-like protein
MRAPAPVLPTQQDRFATLPPAARVFVSVTVVVGAALAAHNVLVLWIGQIERAGLFVELLALALITSTVKVSLPLARSGSTISLTYAISMTALLVLDSHQAFLINVASAWSQCTFNKKVKNALYRTLFSMATVGIAIQGAAWMFEWLSAGEQGVLLGIVRPLAPAIVVYFILNSFLVAGAVSLSTRDSLRTVWLGNFVWSAPGYFVGGAVAALASIAAGQGNFFWSALVAVPLYLTYQSYRLFIARIEDEQAQVRRLSEVQLATIEALALAIEVKDHTSQAHIRRIQVYCEGLAAAVGMRDDEIRGLKTAALLHDIGNLAVPEDILTKPGPLSEEEFQRVKIHPRVGADILDAVPFPYPVAPLILAHHEHWDGTGYPNSLAGEAIPIGARVLSVVDVFTALLADRPYRGAKSYDEAVGMLREHAGRKLDPRLVDVFITLLPTLDASLSAADALQPATRFSQHEGSPRALEDIAGAHREAKALYEIAQALGSSLKVDETFALIAEKLDFLLPLSSCALFLRDDATGEFRCVQARGHGADAIAALGVESEADLASALPADAGGEPGLRSLLAHPLVFNDRAIGALAIYHRQDAAYTAEHRRILERVTQRATPVIYNALIFEETQAASLTDALTGLLNRRGAQLRIEEELARAEAGGTPFSVLLLDLDGLKHLNDHFGHHAGDRALRSVALALRSKLRPSDICARYAGDEFVVALPGCGLAEADTYRRQLQAAVDALTIDLGHGKLQSLAISAGAAVFPRDGTTLEALVATADQRMYRNKTARKASRANPQSGNDDLDLAV